jgi:hypothetical protein
MLRPFFSPEHGYPADSEPKITVDITTFLIDKLTKSGSGVRWSASARAALARVSELLARAGAPPAVDVSLAARAVAGWLRCDSRGVQGFTCKNSQNAVVRNVLFYVEALLELKATPKNTAYNLGSSPLLLAVISSESSSDMVSLLLEHGADPNFPPMLGFAHRAADVALLIEHKAELDGPFGVNVELDLAMEGIPLYKPLAECSQLEIAVLRGRVGAREAELQAGAPSARGRSATHSDVLLPAVAQLDILRVLLSQAVSEPFELRLVRALLLL